jgi:hypothetical protein
MPVHDWTRVDSGIFHSFHNDWVTEISRALNRGLLPPSYYALPEQIAGGLGPVRQAQDLPDVLGLRLSGPGLEAPVPGDAQAAPEGGVALAVEPPQTRFRIRSEANRYAAKAKAVVIRHVSRHQVVAMVEIVSPGNKNNQNGLNSFIRKAHETLAAGIHLLLLDLFPPGPRDPQGIHPLVWGDEVGDDGGFTFQDDKPLTLAAYMGGADAQAFVETLAAADPLPKMPLFLTPEVYIWVPLELTYDLAWQGMPAYWRGVLST